ncbi:MAG: hypothetical protein KAI47_10465, partial [Deltaproteobacteria bacterium]|nr:hypothetical protein [Deltaproteobacteria bacterium]
MFLRRVTEVNSRPQGELTAETASEELAASDRGPMIIEEALDPLILGGKHTNGIGVQIGKLGQKEEKRL